MFLTKVLHLSIFMWSKVLMLSPVEETKRWISDGAVKVTFGNEHTSTITNRERILEPVVASLTEHERPVAFASPACDQAVLMPNEAKTNMVVTVTGKQCAHMTVLYLRTITRSPGKRNA